MFDSVRKVSIEILNDGGYDGFDNVTFPVRIDNCIDYGIDLGLVDVPVSEAVKIGYDVDGWKKSGVPDFCREQPFLAFSYAECRIVE